jgi:uncharacterized membrane protein YozB (DUF420 family)
LTKIEHTVLNLIGLLVLLVGAYMPIGWTPLNPEMVKIIPISTAIVLNTAICFMVASIWFLLSPTALAEPEQNAQAIAAKILQTMTERLAISGEKINVTTNIGIAITQGS